MNTHQVPSIISRAALFYLLLMFSATTPVQAREQDGGPAPVVTPKRQLHIDYGITNGAYRRQVLALMPLGSSDKQVKAFAQTELQTETHPGESIFDPALFGQRNTPEYVKIETAWHKVFFVGGLFNEDDVRDQPPHAKNVFTGSGFIKGTEYINPSFQTKPFPFGSWINLSVFFVFDGKHKLVDVYCVAGGRHLVGS